MPSEWDACEDCMGTGGGGACFACGGSGRLPANGTAADELVAADLARKDRIWDQIAAEMDGDGYDAEGGSLR